MYKILGADGKEYGPVSPETLKEWIAQSRADKDTQVLVEGATQWQTLATVPEFAAALSAQSPPPPAAFPPKRTNGAALTGFLLGILAVTIGCCCCYGFPFNVASIIFSIIGLAQIRNNPEEYSGSGMAITGLVLSLLSILFSLAFLIFGAALNWNEIMNDVDLFKIDGSLK